MSAELVLMIVIVSLASSTITITSMSTMKWPVDFRLQPTEDVRPPGGGL